MMSTRTFGRRNYSNNDIDLPLTIIMIAWLGLTVLILGCAGDIDAGKSGYPPARRGDVVDDYHGTSVADPYRWLEDAESDETKAFVEAQNRLTASFVASPKREKVKERITQLLNYARYSVPDKKGDRYFFWKNDGLQDQSVLYMQKTSESEASVLLDPNKLSEDGTVSVSTKAFNEDGTLLAYGLSTSGSDWQELHILDVNNRKDFDEVLKWCRFTGVAWKHDNSGFFYDRYPDTTTTVPEDRAYNNKLYWHTLGTPQSEDLLVYERPDMPELGFNPQITSDGKYLLLSVWHGTDRENRVYYRRVDDDGDFVRLLDDVDANYQFIENFGTVFYFETDLNAPHGRIVAFDIKRPKRKNWIELVPEQGEVISSAMITADKLLVAYIKDAHHVLRIHDVQGAPLRDIQLPAIGSVQSISGRKGDEELFFQFSSYLYPRTIYRYDVVRDELTTFRKPKISFDPTIYETRQVFYPSKDSTKIPMFITHRKSLPLDGSHPTILYGYGGFKVNMTPRFSTSVAAWLESGGIWAEACLRGGNEYGEEWHAAGMLDKKQNVFDDFIAGAEWLIENKYTDTRHLAIKGGSNGGLLVAACMVQRPELFGAVLCGVPLTDMLRYQRFTVGRYWVGEYGNAEENAEQFEYLYKYSPLHNVEPGTVYPPALITSADTDDRVVPAHARKFAAALQAADAGDNPILLRVETRAGHGGGKPISKWVEEISDVYSFLFKVFKM